MLGHDGPIVRHTDSIDDNDGMVAYAGDDYFVDIMDAYLATDRARVGKVGDAIAELIGGQDLVEFAVAWMGRNLG